MEEKLKDLCKRCYDECEKNNWDSDKIKSRKTLTSRELKLYAKKYMEEYLRLPEEEINKKFLFFLDRRESRFIITHKNIIKMMIKYNYIEEQFMYDQEWVEKNLRIVVTQFCYELEKHFNWSSIEIKKICDDNSINFNQVGTLRREYINETLKWTEEQKEEFYYNRLNQNAQKQRERLKETQDSEYVKTLNSILKEENEEEFTKIIESSNLGLRGLKNYVPDYVVIYHSGSVEIKENLNRKFDMYFSKLSSQRQKEKEEQKEKNLQNNITQAKKLIAEFLMGDYVLISELCSDELNLKTIKKYIELVKKYDITLYNKYLEKLNLIGKEKYIDSVSKNKEILELMDKGILENGVKRDFDIIDYYQRTNLSLEEFLEPLKSELNSREYRVFKTFVNKYINDEILSEKAIENIYITTQIVGIKYDEDGKIIPGTGKIITIEEKQAIINFLQDNNVPITRKAYNIAFKRWLSGSIDINSKSIEKTK